MHRRAVPTLVAALCGAAILAPATAGAYTIGDATAVEGQPLAFAVDEPLTTYSTESGSAIEGVDFTATSTTSLGGTVEVPTIQDDVYERPETMTLRGPDAGADTGTGTITDDDPMPALSLTDASAPEADGTATLTLTATIASGHDLVVPLSTPDGSELVVPANVTLPAGAKSVEVTVTFTNDAEDELDEAFPVQVGTTPDSTNADGEGVVTIVNDDLRVLDVTDVSTPEGTGSNSVARFTVTLNAATFRRVSVAFTTVDGQAMAPRDYLGRFGRVVFEPGQRIAVVDVGVVGDGQIEPSEAFALRLADPDGGRIGDGDAIGVVVDDDSAGPGGRPITGDVMPPEITLGAPKASGRRITLRVSCPRGESRCAGRISLFTVPDRRARARSLRRELRVGAKAFRLSAGRAQTVAITVPAAIARAARSAGRLKVEAFAVTQDADGNVDTRTRRATLRYGKRRSR